MLYDRVATRGLSSSPATLRRYIDLPKLLHLISTRSLYLSRLDHFPDKFEGVLPARHAQLIDQEFRLGLSDTDPRDEYDCMLRGVYVSCWSKGEQDNMALWQLYRAAKAGVALVTTTERLAEAANGWEVPVNIWAVKYVDHFARPKNRYITTGIDILQYKNVAYSFENEVRLILSQLGQPKSENLNRTFLQFPVDVERLVQRVIVGPEATAMYVELIRDLLAHYGLSKITVEHSKLAFPPLPGASQRE